jgi:hypothetical protein
MYIVNVEILQCFESDSECVPGSGSGQRRVAESGSVIVALDGKLKSLNVTRDLF